MDQNLAHQAGHRFFVLSALCAGGLVFVAIAAAGVGLWTSLGLFGALAIGIPGVALFGACKWYLASRYRVVCPQCEDKTARFARDTLNRQILDCPQCGYRASTGRKVLADSPFGH